jgi:uncharacterized protein YbbC (DUF1343 family)
MYPDKFSFHDAYFDRVLGTSKVRRALLAGASVAQIAADWEAGLAAFMVSRKPYLLYPER